MSLVWCGPEVVTIKTKTRPVSALTITIKFEHFPQIINCRWSFSCRHATPNSDRGRERSGLESQAGGSRGNEGQHPGVEE